MVMYILVPTPISWHAEALVNDCTYLYHVKCQLTVEQTACNLRRSST